MNLLRVNLILCVCVFTTIEKKTKRLSDLLKIQKLINVVSFWVFSHYYCVTHETLWSNIFFTHSIIFFFFFWPHWMACGILVPWPGVKSAPPAVEAWCPNHWTTREFPIKEIFIACPLCAKHCFRCWRYDNEQNRHKCWSLLNFKSSAGKIKKKEKKNVFILY